MKNARDPLYMRQLSGRMLTHKCTCCALTSANVPPTCCAVAIASSSAVRARYAKTTAPLAAARPRTPTHATSSRLPQALSKMQPSRATTRNSAAHHARQRCLGRMRAAPAATPHHDALEPHHPSTAHSPGRRAKPCRPPLQQSLTRIAQNLLVRAAAHTNSKGAPSQGRSPLRQQPALLEEHTTPTTKQCCRRLSARQIAAHTPASAHAPAAAGTRTALHRSTCTHGLPTALCSWPATQSVVVHTPTHTHCAGHAQTSTHARAPSKSAAAPAAARTPARCTRTHVRCAVQCRACSSGRRARARDPSPHPQRTASRESSRL